MSLNILVVDDSTVMRKIITKSLNLCGVPVGQIHEASNGREGLDVLEENWVDLILVDINMPVMNGEAMIDAIRADSALNDIPIIVISTESSETRREILQTKTDGFIHKPFTPEVLREVISNVIGGLDEGDGGTALQIDGPDF